MKPAALRSALFLAAIALCALPGTAAAQTIKILYAFGNTQFDASGPKSKLLEGPDGAFYGTSFDGGEFNSTSPINGDGAIFRVTAQGAGGTIYSFTDGDDGDNPVGALALGPDGETMYGTANNGANASGVIYTVTTSGSFNVIHTFAADTTQEGLGPNGSLVLGPDNQTFYGTTQNGGPSNNGVIYSVSITGSLNVLHYFSATTSGTNIDGAQPAHGLVFGLDGALYGVAPGGGQFGNGTVYRITTTGSFSTLHSFSATDANGINTDGATPTGELELNTAVSFAGVTSGGGQNGLGTVYTISFGGALTPYYHFTGGKFGAYPLGVTVGLDSHGFLGGLLCGLTQGGMFAGGSGFLLYPNHKVTDYSFTGGADGEEPSSGLTVGSDGNFYGTTSFTNSGAGKGSFFEIELNSKTIEPFANDAGRYYGLISNRAGYITADLAPTGKIAGKLIASGHTSSFKTTLSSTGILGPNSAGLALKLATLNYASILTGSADGVPVVAFRAAVDAGGDFPAPGKYTLLLTTSTAASATPVPTGLGEAVLTVSKAGIVSIGGKLADGSSLTSSGLILQGTTGAEQYLFFKSADLTGSITFDIGSDYDCFGSITWSDLPGKNRYFPAGFTTTIFLDGAFYIPPSSGRLAIPLAAGNGNGLVTISGGGLTTPIEETVTLTPQNKIIVPSPNTEKLKFELTAKKGTFTGSFIEPSEKEPTPFTGILYQNPNLPAAFGGFLAPTTTGATPSGKLLLQSPPAVVTTARFN